MSTMIKIFLEILISIVILDLTAGRLAYTIAKNFRDGWNEGKR